MMSLSERATAARLPAFAHARHTGASLDTPNSLSNSTPMTAARDGDEKVVAVVGSRLGRRTAQQ